MHLCRTFTFSICFMIKNVIFCENYAKQWSRQGGSTVNKNQTWQVQTLPVQYLCLSQRFLRPSYCFWPLQLYRDLFAIKDGGGSRHQQVAVYSWVKLCRNKVTYVICALVRSNNTVSICTSINLASSQSKWEAKMIRIKELCWAHIVHLALMSPFFQNRSHYQKWIVYFSLLNWSSLLRYLYT